MRFVAIALIKLYQKLLSPLFAGSCRFYPSCSNYSIDAFREHGFFKGMYLTAKRILRCNPFFEGGYDPVPEKHCSHNLKTINKI
jgi:putative membrane protein insertion efficiency factor